jgi:hypothetical protein
MKYAIAVLILALTISEANAVVYCAAGVYHAGCVRRPPVAAPYAHPYAHPYVAPHCYWRAGVRVCR